MNLIYNFLLRTNLHRGCIPYVVAITGGVAPVIAEVSAVVGIIAGVSRVIGLVSTLYGLRMPLRR